MRHLAKLIIPCSLAVVTIMIIVSTADAVGSTINNANAAHRAALEIPYNE